MELARAERNWRAHRALALLFLHCAMTSSTPAPRPLLIFVAYAHEDVVYRDRLVKIMVPWEHQGLVKVWSDHKLAGGDVWDEKIKEGLEAADLILILMSMDAIASDYMRGVELRRAMERHQQGTVRVVPVIIRLCAWKEETWLGQVQAIPRNETRSRNNLVPTGHGMNYGNNSRPLSTNCATKLRSGPPARPLRLWRRASRAT